jgi:hypothetical protein
LANLGYQRPAGRTIVKLTPANLKTDAGALDLPIAIGTRVAAGRLLPDQLRDFAMVGELALDGSVRPVNGAPSMAMAARDLEITKGRVLGATGPNSWGRFGTCQPKAGSKPAPRVWSASTWAPGPFGNDRENVTLSHGTCGMRRSAGSKSSGILNSVGLHNLVG